MKSWKKHLSGYQIKLWDYNSFPRGKSAWVDQAFDSKKYAFAADYIRAYALYHEGGIYLDSDVEVLRNFDDFIELPYFFGQESDSGFIEAAVMGSEKGNKIFKTLLDYYDTHPFILSDGSFDTTPLPRKLNTIINTKGNVNVISDIRNFNNNDILTNIFAPEFFSPIHIINMKLELTANTVSIHHFAGSWNSSWTRFKKNTQRLIGPRLTSIIQNLKHSFSKK